MEAHILKALDAAERQHITGKEITPFLLKYLADHTDGESLQPNIVLILHNASLGAKIAVAFSNL
jgi:pseudouridine-5'-phosphate glycosidase